MTRPTSAGLARDIAERGATVEFAVPATVVRLLEVSGLAIAVHDIATPLPQTDFHIPVSSLPHRLGITLEQVMSSGPSVGAAGSCCAQHPAAGLTVRSGCCGSKIGIAWAARPTHPWAIRRSILLEWLTDFQTIPGRRPLQLTVRSSPHRCTKARGRRDDPRSVVDDSRLGRYRGDYRPT